MKIEHNVDARDLFTEGFGCIVAEVPDGKVGELSITYTVVGEVLEKPVLTYQDVTITLNEAEAAGRARWRRSSRPYPERDQGSRERGRPL